MDGFADQPAIAETSPGYRSIGWHALFAPADLPDDITQRLSREVAAIIQERTFGDRLAQLGKAVRPSTPASLGERMAREAAELGPIMKESGIRID